MTCQTADEGNLQFNKASSRTPHIPGTLFRSVNVIFLMIGKTIRKKFKSNIFRKTKERFREVLLEKAESKGEVGHSPTY